MRSAEFLALLLDAYGIHDRPPAQASFDEVHRTTLETGEGRAKKREELVAAAAEPPVTEQRDEGMAEGRLSEPGRMFEDVRNPEPTQHGLEGRPPAICGLANDRNTLERRTGSAQLEELRSDELDGAARARPFQKLDGALERQLHSRPVTEEPAFDVRQRGRHRSAGRRRKLGHRAASEAGQVAHRVLERGERNASGLVRDRHGDVRPCRKRLDQRPLGCGEILEAVSEYRRTIPGVEFALYPLGGATAEAVSIPQPERAQLRSIGAREAPEIAFDSRGIDKSRFQLSECSEKHLREPSRRRRVMEGLERRRGNRSPRCQRPLRPTRDGEPLWITEGDVLEEIVEGADAARKQRRSAREEISLDALDVTPVGDDQPRIALEHVEVALEEQGNLAGMRRPDDERKAHSSMVVLASDAISYASRACVERARNREESGSTGSGLEPLTQWGLVGGA